MRPAANMLEPHKPRSARKMWLAIFAIITLVLVGANVHLLSVAIKSQPECVTHDKVMDDDATTYRAAKSSCRKAPLE